MFHSFYFFYLFSFNLEIWEKVCCSRALVSNFHCFEDSLFSLSFFFPSISWFQFTWQPSPIRKRSVKYVCDQQTRYAPSYKHTGCVATGKFGHTMYGSSEVICYVWLDIRISSNALLKKLEISSLDTLMNPRTTYENGDMIMFKELIAPLCNV